MIRALKGVILEYLHINFMELTSQRRSFHKSVNRGNHNRAK